MLTIDRLRLIDDQRFQLVQAGSHDWTLMLAQPRQTDEGKLEPKQGRASGLQMT